MMAKKEEQAPKAEESLEENLQPEEEMLIEDISPEELLEELQVQLEAAQAEAAENLDGWQRSQAELINYRNRILREQEKMREDAVLRIAAKFLDVLDDFDRALQNRPEEGEGAQWAEGILLIQRKVQTTLENEGVVEIEAEGQLFDPNLHLAVLQQESPDHESGQIIEVLQKGYRIGDRVVRAAKVRIAS